MNRINLNVLIICILFTFSFSANSNSHYPSVFFDFSDWKLQIPGPTEIKSLADYSSSYFSLDTNNNLVFSLDASEKGHTQNSEYVRSELRHLKNWLITENHELSGEAKVISNLTPDKVTVLQIHGITDDNKNAPPLLRIALNGGDLYAFLKTSNSEDKTESILLEKNISQQFFNVDLTIKDGILKIKVNNEEKLQRDLKYWKFKNYFKLGCYPQAKEGNIKVIFRKFSVS